MSTPCKGYKRGLAKHGDMDLLSEGGEEIQGTQRQVRSKHAGRGRGVALVGRGKGGTIEPKGGPLCMNGSSLLFTSGLSPEDINWPKPAA